jgi:hypothetical protein
MDKWLDFVNTTMNLRIQYPRIVFEYSNTVLQPCGDNSIVWWDCHIITFLRCGHNEMIYLLNWGPGTSSRGAIFNLVVRCAVARTSQCFYSLIYIQLNKKESGTANARISVVLNVLSGILLYYLCFDCINISIPVNIVTKMKRQGKVIWICKKLVIIETVLNCFQNGPTDS